MSIINFQKKKLFSDLIIKTMLIIFLLLICYISYFGFTKKYLPLRLNKFQYNQAKGQGNLLEGFSDLEQGVPAIEDFTYAQSLARCPPYQCAIDMETGLKRCPEEGDIKSLIYNISYEVCTKPESCDYEKLPYAVFTDGTAEGNLCEEDIDGKPIPCRCTDKKTCKGHVVSRFLVSSGDINGFQQNYTPKSFQISQEIKTNQSELGYFNVQIDDTSNQFCQLNPGFTDILVHGCDFKNSIQDKLGCEFINSVSIETPNDAKLNWEIWTQNKTLWTGASKNADVEIGNNYLILATPLASYEAYLKNRSAGNYDLGENLVGEKYLRISGKAGYEPDDPVRTTVVTYQEVIIGKTAFLSDSRAEKYVARILYPIINVYTDPEVSISGTEGFQFKFFHNYYDSDARLNTASNVITREQYTSTFCRFSSTQANYKNMLLCTQSRSDVCNYGKLTYNINDIRVDGEINIDKGDENYTRNFCQLNIENNAKIVNQDYLNDPVFYNVSCSIGPGCDGKSFQNIEDANIESQGRYFPNVDVDGINGVWDTSTNNFPKLQIKPQDGLIYQNVKPGDYWSIKTVNETLLSSEEVSNGVNIIKVENLYGLRTFSDVSGDINDDLAPGMIIPGSSIGTDYVIKKVIYEEDGSTINNIIHIEPSLTEKIEKYQPLNIIPRNTEKLDTYGMIIRRTPSNPGKSFYTTKDETATVDDLILARLDGVTVKTSFDGIKVNLVIYKQFAFSGPNYGTKILSNGHILKPYGIFNRRLYTKKGTQPYEFQTIGGISTYPYPPQDIFQLNLNILNIVNPVYNNSFGSVSAPYKNSISMYYPVWNPSTFQQECIRCRPLLLTFPEINFDGSLINIIIQYCGEDFKNYEYNARAGNYCYVTTSVLDFDRDREKPTTQKIFLKEPNPNIEIGDYVLDSSLQFPFNVYPSGNFSEDYYANKVSFRNLQIVPQIYPSKDAIDQSRDIGKFTSNCTKAYELQRKVDDTYPFSYGAEDSTSENFIFNGNVRYPNQEGEVIRKVPEGATIVPGTPGQYNFQEGKQLPNNYFFGKKYQDGGLYNCRMGSDYKNPDSDSYRTVIPTDGFYFVPSRRVKYVSKDKTIIILNSPFPEEIKRIDGEETFVQFCRLDNPLKLYVETSSGERLNNTKIEVDSMSESRITNIKITESYDRLLQSNPPLIKIDPSGQNFTD